MTAPPPPSRVIEVKRRLDGTELRFECEFVSRAPGLLVALYRFKDARGPVDSYGLFWPRRPYLCYAMHPVSGGPPVYRFDVIRDLRIRRAAPGTLEVAYTDLLLDLWIEDGTPRWEDADEVAAAAASGFLTLGDLGRIDRARGVLERGWRRAIRGAMPRSV